VAADSKLVVALVVGKRTYDQTLALVQDAKDRRRPGQVPAIFTDAYAGYEAALLEGFGRRYPPPGTGRRPVSRWRQGWAYGHVKKHYQGRRVARVEVRAVQGKARLAHGLSLLGYKQINTRVVERHNGTSRLRNQRQVRKPLAFSKVPRYHRWRSGLAVGLYNFCRRHGSLKRVQDAPVQHRSPAMAARLTDHMWTVREWLLCPA
jgi:IS1 family transposase